MKSTHVDLARVQLRNYVNCGFNPVLVTLEVTPTEPRDEWTAKHPITGETILLRPGLRSNLLHEVQDLTITPKYKRLLGQAEIDGGQASPEYEAYSSIMDDLKSHSNPAAAIRRKIDRLKRVEERFKGVSEIVDSCQRKLRILEAALPDLERVSFTPEQYDELYKREK